MCSLGGEDLILYEEPVTLDGNEKCKKCDERSDLIIRKRDAYCRNCFVLTTNHKFRATLGKSKLIKANENVLICLSGGLASMILLELIKNGVNAESHKKLRITPICLHIDESAIVPSHHDKINYLLTQCKESFPCYVSSLSNCFTQNCMDEANEINEKRLRDFFQNLSSETSRREARIRLRTSLIVKIATKLSCNFVLTGETSTLLATTMLSDVALGRGSQLESEVSFLDNRYKDVKILRPMRDITYEELKHLSTILNVTYIADEEETTVDSLQGLIKKFVNDLQDNFPATISTICRTGEKLVDDLNCEKCELCQSTLDTHSENSSALQATEFSRLVSSGQIDDTQINNCKTATCSDCNCSTEPKITKRTVEKYLCYGCRLIIRDMKDESILPNSLKDSIRTRLSLEVMRNEINDFLL